MAVNYGGVNVLKAPKEAIPRCPKCNERLDTIWSKNKWNPIRGSMDILMCPHCETFLGYGFKG